jgi:hypothetical protein
MAKLSKYPSLGYFPQNTPFTLTVSLTSIDNLIAVLNSNGETFEYIQYQVLNDGLKEIQFFLTQPDQNQNY